AKTREHPSASRSASTADKSQGATTRRGEGGAAGAAGSESGGASADTAPGYERTPTERRSAANADRAGGSEDARATAGRRSCAHPELSGPARHGARAGRLRRTRQAALAAR